MKNGKRPTRAQAKLLTANNYNYADWLVVKIKKDSIEFIHRTQQKTIELSMK